MAVVGNKELNKMRERYDLNKYNFDYNFPQGEIVESTPAPTNDRSLLEGIAQFLDYNSNPDNPPIMAGGSIPAEVIEFIMNAALGSRRTDLPSRAPYPKNNELGASRQPGGLIVTDTAEDARIYAKLGSGGDVDPNYGQIYDVGVNPERIENVLNLPRSALDALRTVRGSGKIDYRSTGDQRTADDILKFLEYQSAYNVPDLFSRNMADMLKKEGIGGLMFPTKSGTGSMPSPTRGIISYQKPVYLTPLSKTQNIKRQQEAAAELLKPEFTPEELLRRSRESRQRLLDENTPKYKYDKTLKLKEVDKVLKDSERKISMERYKELKKFKDKFDPEK